MADKQGKSGERTSYKDAGVDIASGNAFVSRIKPLAAATDRAGMSGGIGGFGALFDLKACGYKDPLLVSATDGVGTKLKIANAANRHDTIGIDLVAMCVNDLVVQGAEPLFFLDYFAIGKLDVDIASQVVEGIADGCKIAGCGLVGGETAEMPSLYKEGDYDLAGFAVGAVERKKLLPGKDIAVGDVIIGLASSGLHSNGYSLVRYLVDKGWHNYDKLAPFAPEQSLARALLEPTRIYVKPLLKAIQAGGVKALSHITGGGLLENIPRVLPVNLSAHLDRSTWEAHPVFDWLQREGNVEAVEMYRTFNCGIGMVVIAAEKDALALVSLLNEEGESAAVIGEIRARGDDEGAVIHGG